MPRAPRQELEPGIHHAWARGNNRCAIFVDDEDRSRYLALLGAAVRKFDWRCLGYCLMGTHVHLLVETVQPNLAIGIHWAHGRYAHLFNRRHLRSGHLFQGRYGAARVTSDRQLLTVVEYIDRNPVEAGLAHVPTHWPWGSAAAISEHRAPEWLATARLSELRAGFAGRAAP